MSSKLGANGELMDANSGKRGLAARMSILVILLMVGLIVGLMVVLMVRQLICKHGH